MGADGNLRFMAEVAAAAQVFDHPVEGAIKCKAPGCPNWFVRAGNRHRYCKAENCTYKRGAPSEIELSAPTGAAAEVMRRLQDEDEGEVGPELLARRRSAVVDAMRAGDAQSLAGALVDEATCCIWFADRVRDGNLPNRSVAPTVPGAPVATGPSGQQSRPVGLVQAVVSSHQRTFDLSEHRVKLLWELLKARDELASSEYGVRQMAGSPQEEAAQAVLAERQLEYTAAERAFESIESAWHERALTLKELSRAAGAMPTVKQPRQRTAA